MLSCRCENRSSQMGAEAYSALATEWRLWRALRSCRGDLCRPAIRPIEAYKAAIRDGCFTSILDVQLLETGGDWPRASRAAEDRKYSATPKGGRPTSEASLSSGGGLRVSPIPHALLRFRRPRSRDRRALRAFARCSPRA